jgi:YVTN family beta-propeller protein
VSAETAGRRIRGPVVRKTSWKRTAVPFDLKRVIVAILLAIAASVFGLTSPVAAQSSGPYAYVCNSGYHTVSVIDSATDTVSATIKVGGSPLGVAITPDGQFAYVANSDSNTVSVIDTATNAVVQTINVKKGPDAVAISPNGETVYVSDGNSGDVSVIDVASNAVTATVSVGGYPEAEAVTPDSSAVYVVSQGTDNVGVIDASNDAVTANIPVQDVPQGIAITPDGRTVLVANEFSDTISVIDTSTNSVTDTVNVGQPVASMSISPDGETAYMAVFGEDNDIALAFDISTLSVSSTITLDQDGADGNAETPDGSQAFVGNFENNYVDVIDTSTNTVTADVAVGTDPEAIAVAPDEAPQASLSVSPAQAGDPTDFDASASVATSSPIVSYAWNFGDGDTETTSESTTTHIYTSPAMYTATVTETDDAGTSTTQVFTGATVSNNGGTGAVASQSFKIISCAADTACSGNVSDSSQSSTVSGTSTTDATLSVAIGEELIACGSGPTAVQQVTTYSTTDFTASELSATLTVDDTKTDADVEVCYSSTTAFVDAQGDSVNSGEVAVCSTNSNTPPCIQSVSDISGTLDADLLVLPGDPRFWSPTTLSGFSPASGAVGTKVAIKGGPFAGTTEVIFGKVQAQFKVNSKGSKVTATVPPGAKNAEITIVTADGTATSTSKFKVT